MLIEFANKLKEIKYKINELNKTHATVEEIVEVEQPYNIDTSNIKDGVNIMTEDGKFYDNYKDITKSENMKVVVKYQNEIFEIVRYVAPTKLVDNNDIPVYGCSGFIEYKEGNYSYYPQFHWNYVKSNENEFDKYRKFIGLSNDEYIPSYPVMKLVSFYFQQINDAMKWLNKPEIQMLESDGFHPLHYWTCTIDGGEVRETIPYTSGALHSPLNAENCVCVVRPIHFDYSLRLND